jgi:hypothetical protein
MDRHLKVFFAALLWLLWGGLLPGQTVVQDETNGNELLGTWTLVLVDNVLPDGRRVHLYGDNPQGILTFDADGRYALQIFQTGRPKFASNDKAKGTPEENQAAVQGSNSHFGRYAVNAKDQIITFHVEHASFPNWEGTQRSCPFTVTKDRLKYIVPNPSSGANVTGEVEWQRMTARSAP